MKLRYGPGTVFLVPLSIDLPLSTDLYAVGIIARASPDRRLLFAYFFGPARKRALLEEISTLRFEDAVYWTRCGDLGIRRRDWPIIGSLPNWQAADWPMPAFVRRDSLGISRPTLVRYDDVDPLEVVSETKIDHDHGLEEDGLAGQQYVELVLQTRLLSPH